MPLLELFAHLENANKQEISSFFDYIVKRLENKIKQNEIDEDGIDDIDDDSKDMEIIKETIEKTNNIQADVTTTTFLWKIRKKICWFERKIFLRD